MFASRQWRTLLRLLEPVRTLKTQRVQLLQLEQLVVIRGQLLLIINWENGLGCIGYL
jgi:hypothetical protein